MGFEGEGSSGLGGPGIKQPKPLASVSVKSAKANAIKSIKLKVKMKKGGK